MEYEYVKQNFKNLFEVKNVDIWLSFFFTFSRDKLPFYAAVSADCPKILELGWLQLLQIVDCSTAAIADFSILDSNGTAEPKQVYILRYKVNFVNAYKVSYLHIGNLEMDVHLQIQQQVTFPQNNLIYKLAHQFPNRSYVFFFLFSPMGSNP